VELAHRSLSRRLHAISGIVPVGAFLVFHLAVNSSAMRGAEAYDQRVRRLQQLPFVVALEFALVLGPMAYHGLYGLYLAATRPTGDPDASASRRRLAIFQRATGIPLFAYVLFHLWTTRLVQVAQHDHKSVDLFHWMQALYANPWIRAAYVVGLLCATGHFSVGLRLSAEDWGLARTPASKTAAGALAAAVFLSLAVLGLRSLAAFRLPASS